MNKLDPLRPTSIDEDFALWSAEQAALIRSGRFDRVDLENVAEEIESLGRSDKRAIRSRLTVLMMHLLKWTYQPAERSRSWMATIRDQQRAILDLIDESPSLRSYPAEVYERDYPRAREKAAEETTVFLHLIPETCPYTIEQILDVNFLPGDL